MCAMHCSSAIASKNFICDNSKKKKKIVGEKYAVPKLPNYAARPLQTWQIS